MELWSPSLMTVVGGGVREMVLEVVCWRFRGGVEDGVKDICEEVWNMMWRRIWKLMWEVV